jgi:hypothetical protein
VKKKVPVEWVGGLYMDISEKPKTDLANQLADFMNEKYAQQWSLDMSQGKHPEIQGEAFAVREQMEVAAYYEWQNRGCPHGDSLTDWVNARQAFAKETH